RARSTRPELKQIDHRIEAQDESIRIALSDYYPQLGVFGLFQYGNNPSLAGAGNRAVLASANPFGSLVGDVQLGIVASVNIFDTMNTWTSVKSARIERQRLAKEREQILQQVDIDVRMAHAKLRRLIELIDSLEEARRVALDNVQITEARYQDGDAIVLELLEAQLELFDIERQRTDAVVELMTARVELDAAIGQVPQRKA
ncbi:MAG: TolC family protein, partial [Myxococcota bacterium]